MVWKKMLVEEFQDGCLVHDNLWCENGMICYFWVAIMSEAFLKFLRKRIYGLEGEGGWRIQRWLFFFYIAIFDELKGWF